MMGVRCDQYGLCGRFLKLTRSVKVSAMATIDDVRKLAALARIQVEDAELVKFTSEFDAILAYVGQLETLKLPAAGSEKSPLRNVMRADGEPHEPGIFTKKLAEQFSAREGDALSVKQIISHDYSN
jgi:aspartyl/glutamyl-tRNA(Asn/Gln) amidotransferase C subunit